MVFAGWAVALVVGFGRIGVCGSLLCFFGGFLLLVIAGRFT